MGGRQNRGVAHTGLCRPRPESRATRDGIRMAGQPMTYDGSEAVKEWDCRRRRCVLPWKRPCSGSENRDISRKGTHDAHRACSRSEMGGSRSLPPSETPQ